MEKYEWMVTQRTVFGEILVPVNVAFPEIELKFPQYDSVDAAVTCLNEFTSIIGDSSLISDFDQHGVKLVRVRYEVLPMVIIKA